MKRLLSVLVLSTALSGCAIVDSYLMARYDNVEYDYMVRIKTTADLALNTCNERETSKQSANQINFLAKSLLNFAQYTPRDQNVESMAAELTKITEPFADRYKSNSDVSEMYCKMKLQVISTSTDAMLKVTGKKPH